MIKTELDESSIQVHVHLIKEHIEKEEIKKTFFASLLNITKEYASSFYEYVLERYVAGIKLAKKVLRNIVLLYNALRSYFITKMFWGRGSMYRYAVLISIFIPIVISLFVINSHINRPLQEKRIAITNAFINQASVNVNQASVSEGKLVSAPPSTTAGLASWYTVGQNDTLDSVSKQFNINADIIKWANNLTSDTLTKGQQLIIFPKQGIIYTIQKNDTIDSISKTYNIPKDQITAWNLLDETKPLNPGDKIFLVGVAQPDVILSDSANNVPLVYSHVNYAPSAGCNGISWCFTQIDPQWSGIRMGSRYAPTIGQAGCLITDVAMVTKYYSELPQYAKQITPLTPAQIALNSANFAGYGLFTLTGWNEFNVTPIGGLWGNTDWVAIDQQIALGHPVIVGIPYANHWVVIYAKENGHYIMNDPAYGGGLVFDKYYNPKYTSQAFLYMPN